MEIASGEDLFEHLGLKELRRWLYGSSSGGGRMVSSKSMDMWSV